MDYKKYQNLITCTYFIAQKQIIPAKKLIVNNPLSVNFSFFQEILNDTQLSSQYFSFIWAASCFLARFSKKENIFSKSYNFYQLYINNDKIISQLKPYLVTMKDHEKLILNDNEFSQISNYLLYFHDRYPELFYTFKHSFQYLLQKLKPERLLKIYKLPALYLFEKIDETLLYNSLFSIPDFEFPSFHEIIQYTTDFKVLKVFQDELSKKYSYPLETPDKQYQINSALTSLVNTSIVTKRHFFDIVAQLVFKAFDECQLDKIPEYIRVFSQFISYFMVHKIEHIYRNFPIFSRLLAAKLPTPPTKSAENAVIRIHNDYKLITLLSKILKTNVTISELKTTSITSLIQHFILNDPELLAIQNLNFFIIPDVQRDQDFDVIYSFLAIKNVLQIIDLGKADQIQNTRSTIESIVNELHHNFDLIKDQSTKQSLLVDIFSLIFLSTDSVLSSIIVKKEETDCINFDQSPFLCSSFSAHILLKFLSELAEPSSQLYSYISHGIESLTSLPDLNPNLVTYIGRNQVLLLDAISNCDWDTAEKLSFLHPKYRKDFILSKSVFMNYHHNYVMYESSKYQKLLNLEIGFSSYNLDPLMYAKTIKYSPQEFDDNQKLQNELDTLLEKRLIDIKERNLLNPLQHQSLWDDLNQYVKGFFQNSSRFLTSKKIILPISKEKARHVNEFFRFFHLLYQCQQSFDPIRDQIHSSSLEQSLPFIIGNALKVGNVSIVSKLVQIFKIDLFEYVMKHSNIIQISSHLLEVILENTSSNDQSKTLSKAESSIISSVNEQIEKYQNALFIPEEPSESTLLYTASTALDNPSTPIEFFDDILFRVDHSKFAEVLLSKIGKIPGKKITDFLSIISYSLSQEQLKKVQVLMREHQLSKIIGHAQGFEAIDSLINSKRVHLLSSYSFHFPEKKTKDEEISLIDFVKRLIQKQPEDLPNFIRSTPSKYQFFAQQLENPPSAVMEICPMHQIHSFEAYLKLPFNIRNKSTFLDSESITSAILNSVQDINNLDQSILQLINNSQVCNILNSLKEHNPSNEFLLAISKFKTFIKIYEQTNQTKQKVSRRISSERIDLSDNSDASYDVFYHIDTEDDPEILRNNYNELKLEISKIVDEYFDHLIHTFKVTSPDTETLVLDQLLELRNFGVLSNETRLNHLIDFFHTHPYTICEKDYSIDNLLDICFVCDLNSIAVNLSIDFSLDMSEFAMKRAFIPMQLSLFEEAKEVLHDYEDQFKSVDVAQFQKSDEKVFLPFLLPFMKEACFPVEFLQVLNSSDINSIQTGEFSNFSIYQNISFKVKALLSKHSNLIKTSSTSKTSRNIVGLASKKTSYKESTDNQAGKILQIHIANHVDYFFFVKRFCSPSSALSLFVVLEDFGNVFSILLTLGENASDAFVHRVYEPAIQFNALKPLEKVFPAFDPLLEKSAYLWDYLEKFFSDRKMYRSLFDVASFRDEKKVSAEASLNIFKTESNPMMKLVWIGSASGLYQDYYNYCMKGGKENKIDSEITKMMMLTTLQKDICCAIYQKSLKIPEGETIDIIEEPSRAPVAIGAIITIQSKMTELEKGILKNLANYFGVTPKQIYRKIAKIYAKEKNPKEIINSVNILKAQGADMLLVLDQILPEIQMSNELWKIIPMLIFSGTPDVPMQQRYQVMLFLEYDCLAEAYGLVCDNQSEFKDILPLIAYRASQVGILEIYERVMSMLENMC